MSTRKLEVVEISTGKVVHAVDVTGQRDRTVERVERGMLVNLDRSRFWVRDTGAES